MKDKIEILRKVQNQRYAIKRVMAPVEGERTWVLTYTTKIEGKDILDFDDHVEMHPSKEACVGSLLDWVALGREICWFSLFEAKGRVDTFYNIDHTDKEVREEFRRDIEKCPERFGNNLATITLTQEIEDYIAEEIATEKWAEQGYRLDEEGNMIYDL